MTQKSPPLLCHCFEHPPLTKLTSALSSVTLCLDQAVILPCQHMEAFWLTKGCACPQEGLEAPPDEEKAPSEEQEVDLADLQDPEDAAESLHASQSSSLHQPAPRREDSASLADKFRSLLQQSTRDGEGASVSGLSASHGSEQHGQVGMPAEHLHKCTSSYACTALFLCACDFVHAQGCCSCR